MEIVRNTLTPILELAIKESLENYESRNEGNSLGDLYLYFDAEEGVLSVYDDMENLLNETQFPHNQKFDVKVLPSVLRQLSEAHLFDKKFISKPFSVNLADKDLVVLDELFFLDDDTIKIDVKMNLWKDFEKDLDDFIKKLLQ
jgi:hypothetical protein